MSLGRQISDGREPEEVACPRCGAPPGTYCTFSSPVPPRAVHPARYEALTGLPAVLLTPEEAPR